MTIAIIGLGYVGLTVGAAFSAAGEPVWGIEPLWERRRQVSQGEAPFREPGLAEAMRGILVSETLEGVKADTIIVCVGTPLEDDGALERAVREVAAHMQDDALVIIRSTVRIGTTRGVIEPILTASGRRPRIAVCPERTVEGNALEEIHSLPQIIGSPDPEAVKRAGVLFGKLRCHIVAADTYEVAETAKLLANSYRDVVFSYANEVARLCDANGVSARDAIACANWLYPRCNIPRPGLVGGPCISKDSYLLLGATGFRPSLIKEARFGNQTVTPVHIAGVIRDQMRARDISKGRIALLGTAFKGSPETDDTRDSPTFALADLLKFRHGDLQRDNAFYVTGECVTVDPIAPADQTALGLLDLFDVIVIATNHPQWSRKGLDGLKENLQQHGLIFDCWGLFDVRGDPDYIVFGG